ncbi:unnamed protein product [Cylicocyclus nassatus]|uniref:Uncharacterized protein n=1 Tax=Cylicocyclus nassatus TaxID=53992 RepID=A0AA36GVK0_CYLNA|nr:unnamed protein product [Cylicocyclus nassatus]
MTFDLLQLLNDKFENLRTISFTNCGFDRDATTFLSSGACSLYKRIRDLTTEEGSTPSSTTVSTCVNSSAK